MKAADRYGEKRIEAACERALAFSSAPALRSITTILSNGQDKLPLEQNPVGQDEVPTPKPNKHGIIRGADAFQKGGDNA